MCIYFTGPVGPGTRAEQVRICLDTVYSILTNSEFKVTAKCVQIVTARKCVHAACLYHMNASHEVTSEVYLLLSLQFQLLETTLSASSQNAATFTRAVSPSSSGQPWHEAHMQHRSVIVPLVCFQERHRRSQQLHFTSLVWPSTHHYIKPCAKWLLPVWDKWIWENLEWKLEWTTFQSRLLNVFSAYFSSFELDKILIRCDNVIISHSCLKDTKKQVFLNLRFHFVYKIFVPSSIIKSFFQD